MSPHGIVSLNTKTRDSDNTDTYFSEWSILKSLRNLNLVYSWENILQQKYTFATFSTHTLVSEKCFKAVLDLDWKFYTKEKVSIDRQITDKSQLSHGEN